MRTSGPYPGKSVLRSVKQKRTPAIRANRTIAPPFERRAAAGSISEPSPTSRQTWVRDSNALRVRGSSFLSTFIDLSWERGIENVLELTQRTHPGDAAARLTSQSAQPGYA